MLHEKGHEICLKIMKHEVHLDADDIKLINISQINYCNKYIYS